MAVTNEYGVPVHPWSWVPSLAGFGLIGVPLFLIVIEVAAWRSPWVLGAIAGGLGSSAVAWVLDREASRQTKVVRAHLGMRWGETMHPLKEHTIEVVRHSFLLFLAVVSFSSGVPWAVTAIALAGSGWTLVKDVVAVLQGRRREREGRAAPECPDLAPVPLTSEAPAS
ncbi:MAG: hypothetical protein PIR53_09965 [Nocardioides alkalitolerans]